MIDIYGYLWIFMDIYGYLWDHHRNIKGIDGYLWDMIMDFDLVGIITWWEIMVISPLGTTLGPLSTVQMWLLQ